MAQEVRLQATITGEITVGANPQLPNEFALTIENKGDVIVAQTRTPPNLYLKGKLGEGEGAFFAVKEAARENCTVVNPGGGKHEWFSPADDAFFLKFYTYDDTLFAQGAAI